jgi:hypothetical protein
MGWFWGVIGGCTGALLLVAWRMDARVRRRGSQVSAHSDVWFQVRESRRDAEAAQPMSSDVSWTSWSRRNRS